MIEIICKKCVKKYGYELCENIYPEYKDKETADCPYCGETGYSTMTSQIIVVTKLEDDNLPDDENEDGEANE